MSRDGMTGTTRRAFATVARTLREEAARAERSEDVALAQELRRDSARIVIHAYLIDERRKHA
jgi:hypothetical protein